jgi:hypothetical protein
LIILQTHIQAKKKSFKQDKHIKNVYSSNGFGETLIAANIIACGDEDIRDTDNEKPIDKTIFAMRVISTYVTFYKAEIPAKYWSELSHGLPKSEVIIKRWPGENAKRKGLDLVEPDGRRKVLEALANIRQCLLRHKKPVSDLYMTPITRVPNSPNWWV